MRAVEVLRTAVEANLEGVHQRRLHSLWRTVVGLILGGQLYLTGLGRSLPAQTAHKHRIKAVDRLLGNTKLHSELNQIYRAIACCLLRRVTTPIILLDWTGAGSRHVELSAKLCSDGRALPLLSRVFPNHDNASVSALRQFLAELKTVLPNDCKPILVTDAGFSLGWFDALASSGWDYIGRVRGALNVVVRGTRYDMKQLHRLAGAKPRDLGTALLGIKHPRARRLILSQEPRPKGRKRTTRRGKPGRAGTDRTASRGAREPWVLVTSLRCSARAVVQSYGLRMQIEQSFRDRKNLRTGWSMRLANTRSRQRLDVMVLIASLADLVTQLAGRAAANTATAHGFQANTVRDRRVHSFVRLGTLVLRGDKEAARHLISRAMEALLATIRRNAELCGPPIVAPTRRPIRVHARRACPGPSGAFAGVFPQSVSAREAQP